VKEIIDQNIYCPRAVAYRGTVHASEGGGGIYVTCQEATDLGATEIEIGEDGFGWAKWPAHYWAVQPKFIAMKVTGEPGDRRVYGGF
jgi:hypothetical protein